MVVTFIFTKISIINSLLISLISLTPTPCNQVQVNGTTCYVTYPTAYYCLATYSQSAGQQILNVFTSSVAKNLKVFTSYKLKTLRIYQVSSSSLKVAISQLYLPICMAQRTQLNAKAHNQESRISFSRQVPTDLKPYYRYFIIIYSQLGR